MCICLAGLHMPACALLRLGLLIPREQSLDLRRDFPLVHGHAPLLVHFQFLSEPADGRLPAGHQLLQILVAELLPGAALPGTLPAPLQLGLQVNFGGLPAALAWLLHFASDHLTVIHLEGQAGLAARSLPLPAPAQPAWPGPAPAPGEEGDMVPTAASSLLTLRFP